MDLGFLLSDEDTFAAVLSKLQRFSDEILCLFNDSKILKFTAKTLPHDLVFDYYYVPRRSELSTVYNFRDSSGFSYTFFGAENIRPILPDHLFQKAHTHPEILLDYNLSICENGIFREFAQKDNFVEITKI